MICLRLSCLLCFVGGLVGVILFIDLGPSLFLKISQISDMLSICKLIYVKLDLLLISSLSFSND